MSHISKETVITIVKWHLAALVLLVGVGLAAWIRHQHQYDALMVQIGKEHGLNPRLISAVIWKESRYKPQAVGSAGEVGLMQVTELVGYEWAGAHGIDDFTKEDLFKPEINLQAGTWYLARAASHWTMYDDPIPYALAEYNAGYANVTRWSRKASDSYEFMQRITYPNTQRYVRDILKRYRGKSS